MKCTQCDKPDAKRAGYWSFRGRRHILAFCCNECARQYRQGKEDYAKSVERCNPFSH